MTSYRDPMQRMVAEFHAATGATIGSFPAMRDTHLRRELVVEEAEEFFDACGVQVVQIGGDACEVDPDFAAAIKELCDVLYVAHGTAVAWGIDILPFFERVHESNMSKIGGPVRADGKRLKGPNYKPADFGGLL